MTTENNLTCGGSEVNLSRYSRQIRFGPLGEAGQRRLLNSRVLVCGCGALGSVAAETLVRAGVGFLRVVDRDFLELHNLQRQVLFDEQDVVRGLPKAIAAAEKLQQINSQVTIDPVVADVTYQNISHLTHKIDLILDGTDNFETRMLLNDFAVKYDIPWVYGGCIGAEGQTMLIQPGKTACLSCLLPELPSPGVTPTCETAGILGPVVNIVASLQASEAIKYLAGQFEAISRRLTVLDLWQNRFRQLDLSKLREANMCQTCSQRKFPWLEGKHGSQPIVLCGRNAVQVSPAQPTSIALAKLADNLRSTGEVQVNPHLLRLTVGDYQLTVFADGRTIVTGTEDLTTARSLVAKYIGS